MTGINCRCGVGVAVGVIVGVAVGVDVGTIGGFFVPEKYISPAKWNPKPSNTAPLLNSVVATAVFVFTIADCNERPF